MSQTPEYQPEKFPKTSTMPGGWDLSSIISASESERPVSEEVVSEDRDGNVDKFPKTNTFPSGWDLSGYLE